MSEPTSHGDHTLRMYGVIFTVIAVIAGMALLYLLVVRSQADTSNQSAAVANAAPTVDTVITAVASGGGDQASVSVIESSTKRVYVRGVATDNNGCNDIDTMSNWAYRTYRTPQGVSCTADNNDCYLGNTSNLTAANCAGAGDLNLDYEGYVDLQFYADATDTGSNFVSDNWTWSVTAQDETASATGSATDTYEVNGLIGLDVTASINYGSVVLNADSAVQTATITQAGNRSFDINRSTDGDMICNGQGSQNIPVGQVKRHLTDSAFAWTDGAAAALSASVVEDELNMGRRTVDASALTKAYYLRLRMPATGLRGTCTNVLTLTAIAEENP